MMFPQATSHGNILTFTPPGFKHSLNVKFPDSRLAVCEKCKKNFKTRDMCRVRNTHTAAPWSTAYICITVDESCTDEEGKYVDKPLTVRMVQWQPFCTKKPFDSKTPVCSACKRTNRTRSFCRERHKHRHLPWCTVYVLLSALDQTDPQTVVAGASKKVGDEDEGDAGEAGDAEESTSATKVKAEESSTVGSETAGSEPDEDSDDINDIAESRTFLAKVSSRATSIHWLDLAEYDLNADQAYPGANPHEVQAPYPPPAAMAPGDPQAQYFHAMGYAAQQHQNALKSHQQYFFQMQQRQHYQQAPHTPWQYNMGPGEQHHVVATAGEAAAAQAKRGPEEGYPMPSQQWAVYYGQGYPPEHGPPPAATPPDNSNAENHYEGETNGDTEDVEAKRQRVV